MEKKLSIIINVLIILLIMVLISVMLRYYLHDSNLPIVSHQEVDEYSGDIIYSDKQTFFTEVKENVIKSGDDIEQFYEEPKEPSNKSGDNTENNTAIKSPAVIISSENEISSKEKGEILTEIDKTLMELLEVVDKVKTVDETKLIIDDSEVQ